MQSFGCGSHGAALISRLASEKVRPSVIYTKFNVLHKGGDERQLREAEWEHGVKLVATGSIHGTPFELSCFLDTIVQSMAHAVHHPAQPIPATLDALHYSQYAAAAVDGERDGLDSEFSRRRQKRSLVQ